MTFLNRRTGLWALLALITVVLFGTLVWLVGRFEQSRFEIALNNTVGEIASEIRLNLARQLQQSQVLLEKDAANWQFASRAFLESEPTILRVERRSRGLRIEALANTPFLNQTTAEGVFSYHGREEFAAESALACILAAHVSEASFSNSYFVPTSGGIGFEVTDMCIARFEDGKPIEYLVVTYSLDRILKEWGAAHLKNQEELSLREADGSRLAVVGDNLQTGQPISAATVLNLKGNKLLLHITSWKTTPYWLANTPTAIALILVLALAGVLWMLYRDTRKRHRTEAQLAREIIQQRKAEEVSRQSLERLQKSARLATLGEMASMMSHELNQPLAAITSYASGSLHLLATSEQGKPHPEDIAQITTALERIAAQSERAGLVIKSVHNFVRRRETDHTFVAPHSLFDSVLPLLNLQAKQMDIQLAIHTAKDLPLVWCDKTLIEQVLINLSRNAMQAMGQAGSIKRRLTLSANLLHAGSERLVEFLVQDTGTGLTAEVAERLFTPFFTTKSEGMGLGLSLCRTVIEQHGSSLAYTTAIEPPHTGTIFSFKLKTERYANIL